MSNYSNLPIRMYKLFHFVTSVIFFIFTWNRVLTFYEISPAFRYRILIYLFYIVLLFFMFRTYNAYLIEYTRMRHIAFALCLSTTLSIIVEYLFILICWNRFFSPSLFIFLIVGQGIFNVAWVWTAAFLYRKIHIPPKSLVIYKTHKDLLRLEVLERLFMKYDVIKYLENPLNIENVIYYMNGIESVFISGINENLRNAIVKHCAKENIDCFFLPHVGDVILMSGDHIQAFSVPLMKISGSNIKIEDAIIKRMFDLVFSIILLILLSPIMILTAIAIKIDDGGAVFYRQERLTRDGKIFKIYKFRSMIEKAEADGIAVLSSGEIDKRVTKIGKIIRKYRIDELPQLFNIIKGDMSIVGPRPERPEIAEEFKREIPSFNLRLQAKAGLTGYAQVYGKYNTDPYDKLEMDLMYISRMSMFLDFQILLATIPIIFRKDSTEGIKND